MNATDPSTDPRPEPVSFSLGTLFLIMSCIGVALVAFRIPGGDEFELRITLAMILVGAFLATWFLATLQFSRLRIAAVPVVIGFVLLVSSTGVISPREASRRAQSGNSLKQIGLALLGYHQKYGSFPPAYIADANGKPLNSWRVFILPEMDNNYLAKAIRKDEAWDGPNNAKSTSVCQMSYLAPSDPQIDKSPANFTSYVAVVGPRAAWSGATPRKLSDFKNPSKTILLVEIAHSGIHWAEPRDLYVGQMAPGINPKVGQGISSDDAGGAHVLYADGSIEFLPDTTDPKKLAELLDIDGPHDTAAEGASR
jgi:hypothetical protein